MNDTIKMNKYKTSFVYVLDVLKTGIKERNAVNLSLCASQIHSKNSNPLLLLLEILVSRRCRITITGRVVISTRRRETRVARRESTTSARSRLLLLL